MNQWLTLFNKEIIENWRNKKWIWVPIVMMLLTMMDPISYYYLPEIIDLAGGVPEGTIIEIPDLAPREVITMSLEQLSMFGVIVIALISMGTIAGERNSGIAEIILVKPVRFSNYVTAKWAAWLLLVWFSLFLGMILNWYYVNLLFGSLSFTMVLQIIFFYGLWFTFVLTLSIFFNTLWRAPGIVFACTIGTIVIMSIMNMIFGHKLTWFPNQLSAHIQEMIATHSIPNALIGTAIVILVLIAFLLFLATSLFKRKEIV